MKLYHLACAAVLVVAPMTAMAQSTVSPSVGANNQKEASDVKTGSGGQTTYSTAPGDTGKATVPGSNSSTATSGPATHEQKKGSITNGGK
jgi:hypothetical protein